MLQDFLLKEHDYILHKFDVETASLAGIKEISQNLQGGSRAFLDELIAILKLEQITFEPPEGGGKVTQKEEVVQNKRKAKSKESGVAAMKLTAKSHGQEFRRLGYSLSEVVHSYGVMCQAVTSSAAELNYQITSREYSHFNLALDVAIALAVTEYDRLQTEQANLKNLEQIGMLAHELRNSLQSACIAQELIQNGNIGSNSQTGRLLDRSLQGMKTLIDSTLLMVRLNTDPQPHLEWLPVFAVACDVELTAAGDARRREITFKLQIDPKLSVFADRQHFTSALSNLTQNAVKFSHPGNTVTLRAHLEDRRAKIEIEDACGGLPEAKLKDLFAPFEQMNKNKTGVGLGLSISRRAIELSEGTISARNVQGKGCVFTIELPGRNT